MSNKLTLIRFFRTKPILIYDLPFFIFIKRIFAQKYVNCSILLRFDVENLLF